MKKIALLLAAVFAAGLAVADDKKPVTKTDSAKTAPAVAAKTHDVDTEVVSVDATAKTITIKGEKDNMVVKVLNDKAVASLKDIKAGEKVTITCQDNAKGEHEGAIAIKATLAAKPAAAPAKK